MSQKPISPETSAAIGEGIVDFLNRQNIKPAIILGQNDFESNGPVSWFSDRTHVNHMLEEAGITNPQTRNTLIQDLQQLATRLNNAHAGVFDGPDRPTLGWNDQTPPHSSFPLTYVVTPNIQSGSSLFSKHTSIPEHMFSDALKNLDQNDLSTYLLFHELGHVSPEQQSMESPERELNSDRHANNLYTKAYKEGLVHDTNVPEFFSYARALVRFTAPEHSDSYKYNGAIDPDTNNDAVEQMIQKNPDFIKEAINDVYGSLGHRTARTEFEVLSRFDNAKDFLSPEDLEKLKDLTNRTLNDTPPPLDEIESFMNGITIPDALKENFEHGINKELQREGWELSASQPGLIYETVKQKLLQGEYNNTPVIKQQMENFVVGAERIAPAHFGIEEGQQPYTDHLRARGENLSSGLPPSPGMNSLPQQTAPTYNDRPSI